MSGPAAFRPRRNCGSTVTWTKRPSLLLLGLLLTGVASFEANGLYRPALVQWPHLFWTLELFTWVLLPSLVVGSALRLNLVTLPELGFDTLIAGRRQPLIFAAFLVGTPISLVFIYTAAILVAQRLFPDSSAVIPFSYGEIVPSSTPKQWRIVAWFYLATTGGVVEEVYYRSMMFHLFPAGWAGAAAYVSCSMLLFASGHWEAGPARVFSTACFGAVTAVLFRSTQNIWPLILGHVLVDLVWIGGELGI